MFSKIREPVMILGVQLINQLKINVQEDTSANSRVSALRSLISDTYDAFLPLCNALTRHQNTERLRVVHEYLVNGGFVNFFLCAPDVAEERQVIFTHLSEEMAPVMAEARNVNRYLDSQFTASLL